MIETISTKEWQTLPEHAQQEVKDFFLFIKAKYAHQSQAKQLDNEAMLLSEQALAKDWLNPEEDKAWAAYQ
ncbi:hypothetical protein P8S54_00605 [Thiomicrospira sp. R3]|uniref:hypothetical protein n=1 Tax=Thiomicrospira sp. R3 TaxID=3035472 RepID=UPI00259B331E|nr:hypothetical protein [Thiomicrospira sp. R3]WFE68773.1 hypothetical protein P8S54_00295 [Thiomicrospira sp. R3]WFE68831.1 hypothetical protein P8S54_00605 [Thiomicrospira sp. R3]